jgi:hypothetical protein
MINNRTLLLTGPSGGKVNDGLLFYITSDLGIDSYLLNLFITSTALTFNFTTFRGSQRRAHKQKRNSQS